MIRNKFGLSHFKLFTGNMGNLIPITWFDVIPGDTIQHATKCLIRVSPLLAPVMHPVRVRIHHWYCPLRLVWEDFEDFITGGPDGEDASVPPYINFNTDQTTSESGLSDYFGIPPIDYTGKNMHISAILFRVYNLIFNNHYRDQDLVSERTTSLASGADVTTVASLASCAWEKDYFTTCRPWDQKGSEITIPLVGDAPITGIGKTTQTFPYGPNNVYETDGSGTTSYTSNATMDAASANDVFRVEEDPDNSGYPNIRADLSAVSGVSVGDLRLALALQRYQEARARYGSRYVEYLRSLGVRSSDARLSMPEYLGGGRQTIQFSEVLSTDGSNTGDMKGHGLAAMKTNRYRRFIEEHGIIMTLMSVLPKTIYSDGIHRSFSRTVKEDYFQKELQMIGQQEVLNKEIYADAASPDDTFGFQDRYDDMRSIPSSIAGEFRSTLSHWNMARIFAAEPALNSSFVTSVPTTRIYASSSTDQLYIMAGHSIQARRMIQKHAKVATF